MSKYKKQPIDPRLRQKVFKRDGYTCRYCGDNKGPFHCDHVYPESKGGKAEYGNLVTACVPCNQAKWAKVGIWPKPIGYYRAAKSLNPLGVVLIIIFLVCFVSFWSLVFMGYSDLLVTKLLAPFIMLCGAALTAWRISKRRIAGR